MYLKNRIPLLILTIIMSVIAMTIAASSTGRITGKIVDKTTGQPLYGVTVIIKGTTIGAKTDIEGNFVINTVPPGDYTLVFSMVGYSTIEMIDVEVKIGEVFEANLKLKQSMIESSKVTTVTGIKEGIDFNQTGTVTVKSQSQLKATPVANVGDLLAREKQTIASCQGEPNFKGGRANKSGYLVDGVRYKTCSGNPPPAHGGSSIVNDQAFDAMFFKDYGVNPFVDTEDDHFSTFATDVDDASFIMARSYLTRRELPPDDAIRVEEFINHFDYNYPAPHYQPFSVHLEGSPSKFGQNCSLLRIGIKGMEVLPENRKSANLVFVIDISGSMDRENRLSLVKRALTMLIQELRPDDKVGIVVYGSSGREIIQPTSIRNKHALRNAINRLAAGGSTNAEEGIRLGYQMSRRNFEKGKINRVILCSDGVANVGKSGPDALLKDIKDYADFGITLSTIGFGMGNYNDILMEKLGNKGNGHYAYVDDAKEARRVFVDNLTGNLQVIARDVKIQVDFNPDVVRSYRLLGYENRDVADDKFRDDKEDGGEVGAGHTVTALYEIKLRKHRTSDKVGTVYIRYKDPDSFEVTEFNQAINKTVFNNYFNTSSPEFRLAAGVAEFSEVLRKSYWARGSELKEIYNVIKNARTEMRTPEIDELLNMISQAEKFQEELAEK